jgi:transcriptional regulator with XRE-family HTH domain
MTTQKHTQEEIGSKIKQLRIEKKMTQAELAEKMNVSSSAISKWEK